MAVNVITMKSSVWSFVSLTTDTIQYGYQRRSNVSFVDVAKGALKRVKYASFVEVAARSKTVK